MNKKNSSQLSLKSSDSTELLEVSPRSEIAEDWQNRQFIENVTSGIQRITNFLNSFGSSYFLLFLNCLYF